MATLSVDALGKFLGSDGNKSVTSQSHNYTPIRLCRIEPDRDPTFHAKIRRHIVLIRLHRQKSLLLLNRGLATKCDPPVVVMIEQIVCKCFFPHLKGDVLLFYSLGLRQNLRQHLADFDELHPPTVCKLQLSS